MNVSNDLSESVIFPKGEELPEFLSKYFTGKVWVSMLVGRDNEFNCPIGNVTFEPGCINNWHKHPGGQILLVTDGTGYYQEKGKPARRLKPGDVVPIPPDVVHWHGAAPQSHFIHVGMSTKVHLGPAAWFGPVTDEEYAAATGK